MRLTKSLISAFAALLLTSGAAFAGGGQSWTSTGQMSSDSTEAGGPGFLGGDTLASEQYNPRYPSNSSETPSATDMSSLDMSADSEMLAESDVIYVYPVQITEYYLLVPSADSELPVGG